MKKKVIELIKDSVKRLRFGKVKIKHLFAMRFNDSLNYFTI